MALQYNPMVIPLLFGGIISAFVAASAWQRKNIPGRLWYVLFIVALSGWMVGYALELTFVDLIPKLFFAKAQYLSIATIVVFWFLFLLTYSGRGRWLKGWVIGILFIIPAITVLAIVYLPDLIWQEVDYFTENGQTYFSFEYGPWFYAHSVYAYLLYLVNTVFITEIALKSPWLDRKRSLGLWIGGLVPWISNAIYLLDLSPWPTIDLTPFALATVGLLTAWSIFRFRLFDVTPVANTAVVKSLPDSVLTLGLDHHILSLNPSAEKLFGRKAIATRDMKIDEIIPNHWYEQIVATTLESENSFEVDYEHEGRRRFYGLRVAPLYDRRDRPIGRLLIIRDVTSDKEVQIMLDQERLSLAASVTSRTHELQMANEELARAARLKDEFLASMSHELRTPLNAIIGTSEALKEEIYGPITMNQYNSLGRVEESAQHLLSLITDILDVSKIESGEFDIKIGPTQIKQVANASLRLIRPNALKKNIKIVSAINTTIPTIQSDERRLKQILVNLLSNAVKFTPQGGKVGLGVFEDAPNRQVHFVVWDTGIGISETDQKRLFQPFVQLDSSLTRQHEGTGLGLALSQHLAVLHGGEITVQSEPDKGSRFTLTLPWDGTIQQPPPPANGIRDTTIDLIAPLLRQNGAVKTPT